MSVQEQEGIVMAPVVPNVHIMGNAFVNDYYKVLVLRPQLLYKFYKDCSTLSRPAPNDQILKGTAVLSQQLASLDYRVVKVEIKTVDSQPSYNNGVFVLVSGLVTFKNNKITPFSQSFFLAPQPNGYFVLNDMFRYVGEKPDQPKQSFVLRNGCFVEQHAARPGHVSESVVKSEALGQDQNTVIDQSTIVVEEPAPVLQKVHMQKSRKVLEGSAGQKVSALEHVDNERPLAIVQDASNKSHASLIKETAEPSNVAVEKQSLGRATARVESSSAHSQATNSTGSQPKASSANQPLTTSAVKIPDNARVVPSSVHSQATNSTSSQPKASSANQPLTSNAAKITDNARVVASSVHSQATNATSSRPKVSSANEPLSSSTVKMTDKARVAPSSAQSQASNSTSSQPKTSSANQPLSSSVVNMTDNARAVPSSAQNQATNSTSSKPKASSANQPFTSSAVNMKDDTRVVPSSANSKATKSTSTQTESSSVNEPSSYSTVNMTQKAWVVPISARNQASNSTSSQPKAATANQPSSSSVVNMTEKKTGEEIGCSIFVDNLPVNVTTRQVEDEMKKFGAIKASGVQVKSRQGGGDSFAFVEFEEAASVQAAVEAYPILIGGRQAYIREKRPFREGSRNDGTRGRGGYSYSGQPTGRSDFMNSEDRGASLSGRASDMFYENRKGGRARTITSGGLKPRI